MYQVIAINQQRRQLVAAWNGGTGFPSCACCAIDTALQDLLARRQRQSCALWMGGKPARPLVYAASIGLSNKTKLIATLLVYRALGLKQFKVKVGCAEDVERIRLIRRVLGPAVTLFADATSTTRTIVGCASDRRCR